MTIRLLKKSINRTQDLMGMRAALDYHFALHEFGHTTRESQQLLHEARERQSLKEYFAKRDKGDLAYNDIGPGLQATADRIWIS